MIHYESIKKIIFTCIIPIVLFGCNSAQTPTQTHLQTILQTPTVTSAIASLPPGAETSIAGNQIAVVGQIGGQTQAVAVSNNHAYVGVGYRMTILDVSDPAMLKELGSTNYLGGNVEDIAVDGNVAYLAAGEAGLFVIDISDDMNPKILYQYDSMGYAEGVTVKGKYVYLADGPDGLIILDANVKSELKEVGKVFSYNYAFAVAIQDNYAYIAAAGAGMLISNISDPAKPTEEGSIYTPGYAYGITISGSTAFIADGWEGLQAIDISDPVKPKAQALYDTYGWAMDVTSQGNKLYVAAANGGLRIFDATTPEKIKDIGYFAVQKSHIQTVAIDGDKVYAADTRQGIHIIDASNPSKPKRIGFYNPMGYAQAVEVSNGYAYVAAQNYGVRVIDLADPARPREVGIFKYGNPFVTMAISGKTAYAGISFGISNLSSELYAINITDPLHLNAKKSIELRGPVTGNTLPVNQKIPESFGMISRNLFVQGDTLYNSGEAGLLLMDVSQPMSPEPSGLFLVTANPSGESVISVVCAAVAGNTAYLAATDGGLYIVDIADPKNLKLIGSFSEQAKDIEGKGTKGIRVNDVAVSGSYVYITDSDLLRRIDVSDPLKPKEVSAIRLPVIPISNSGHSAKTLQIDGDTLFVADSAIGLLAVDISDPKDMKIKQQLALAGHACWVSLDKDNIYVAAEEGGLFVIGRDGNTTADKNPSSKDESVQPVELSAPPDSFCFSQYEPQPLISRRQYKDAKISNDKRKTLTVANTEDDGKGSLRQCLQDAQSGDYITFDIKVFPTEDPAIVFTMSTLWLLKDGVTVDASNAGIILDGSKMHGDAAAGGFEIKASHCTIKGLQMQNFPGFGMCLSGDNNIIGGDNTKGAAQNGEGNVINGSNNSNLVINGVRGNLIKGNIIGLDSSGKNKAGNPGGWGITIQCGAANNRMQDNTIIGCVSVSDPGGSYNEFIGNRLGTDSTGTIAVPGANFIIVNQPFTRIGGTVDGEGNIIYGAVDIGMTSDTVVANNLIGVDASGTKPFEMNGNTIMINDGSNHNFIGGSTLKERNVINGGNGACIVLSANSRNNIIAGNHIGMDISGKTILACKFGIQLSQSDNNMIQGNMIAGAKPTGISLEGSNSNLMRANQLIQNFDGLSLKDSNRNIIRDNVITESVKVGIGIEGGSDNLICTNAFIKNASDCYDQGKSNAWDSGTLGNFWDNYKGTDGNGDGIGDTPYSNDNITDRFPFMQKPPFHNFR